MIANSETGAAYWKASVKSPAGESFEGHISNELKFVEARTNVLSSEGDTQSALFDNVLKQMREADVSKEVAPIVVDIVQPPRLPDADKPDYPRKSLVLALAGLAGFVIGFGTLFVLDGLDSSLKTVDEAEPIPQPAHPRHDAAGEGPGLPKKGGQESGLAKEEAGQPERSMLFSDRASWC